MANSMDNFPNPITLLFLKLDYREVAKTLFIDYGYVDEMTRAMAALEFLKHFFFNTSENEIELFRKRNPQAGMIFDMLDKATEGTQRDARWSAWNKYYDGDDTKTIEDILSELTQKKKLEKKERNRKYYERKKSQKLKKHQIYDPEEEKRIEQEAIKKALEDYEKRHDC